MAGLQFADIDDAVITTQQNFVKKGAFTDLQTDLTKHVLVRELWKGRNKNAFVGGDPWEFEAQVDHNYSAKAVGLYETDTSAFTDTLVKFEVNVKHINANYIYDQREKAFQKGGKKVVDYIYTKYVAMMVSVFEYLETVLWGVPDSGDTKTPYGVGYWVTKSGSAGFNGTDHANFSSGKAGVSSSDQARWANYTDRYVAISKEDLIRKMRKSARAIDFVSPVMHATPTWGKERNGIYVNDDTIGSMEEELEKQNMNLGNDIASKDGRVTFKSTPVTYAPKLNSYSDDPVFMLDWSTMTLGTLAGWENQLSKPYRVADKSKVRRVDLDASLNMICTNLRRQSVINTAG